MYPPKMYSPNFTVDNKTFCLSLDFNGDNCYLFVNGKEVTKFKAKNSELVKYPIRQKTIMKIVVKTQDYMKMFMTLVLIIVLLQMKI